ncbi:hypothetical protein ACOME3_005946 [Neoechinorhynchus agilis]
MSLLHIYCTGQGVVMNRNFKSDPVISNALHSCNYLSSETNDAFKQIHDAVDKDLHRPHVTIYIDRPIDECMNRLTSQYKSAILKDKQYLEAIEQNYQADYLPPLNEHGYVLRYSAQGIDDNEKWKDLAQQASEDMECLDLLDNDDKLADWRILNTGQCDEYAALLSDDAHWERQLKKCYKIKLSTDLTIYGDEAKTVKALLSENDEYRKHVKGHASSSWRLTLDSMNFMKYLWPKRKAFIPFC